MVQFKPYFLGQAKPPYPRATTCQKVFRSVDIDLVGHDGHHLTFFEMLGNFSFGDYFKEKAIPYAYEFLTKDLKLEKERLWAGIHNDDDESFEIWKKTGIPPERIRRFGDEYNFWAAGPTGPCGPDSRSTTTGARNTAVGGRTAGRTASTATAFSRSGTWSSSHGTGTSRACVHRFQERNRHRMGLERITSVVIHSTGRSVFDTDAFQPLLRHFAEEAGKPYGSNPDSDVSMRVLADHARGSTMLLADGVVPANDGRGYVLRRLIRRGMVHARRLGPAVHLSSVCPWSLGCSAKSTLRSKRSWTGLPKWSGRKKNASASPCDRGSSASSLCSSAEFLTRKKSSTCMTPSDSRSNSRRSWPRNEGSRWTWKPWPR